MFHSRFIFKIFFVLILLFGSLTTTAQVAALEKDAETTKVDSNLIALKRAREGVLMVMPGGIELDFSAMITINDQVVIDAVASDSAEALRAEFL